MVEELSNKHAVRDLCEFLEVSRSGYYQWNKGQENLSRAWAKVYAQSAAPWRKK